VVHITDNVAIRDSEYTLGITGEYERLLRYSWQLIEALNDADLELIY
jgi:hypothetical protein